MREGLLDQDGLTGCIQCQNSPLYSSSELEEKLSGSFLSDDISISKIIELKFLVSSFCISIGRLFFSRHHFPQAFLNIPNHSVPVKGFRNNLILNQLQTN